MCEYGDGGVWQWRGVAVEGCSIGGSVINIPPCHWDQRVYSNVS